MTIRLRLQSWEIVLWKLQENCYSCFFCLFAPKSCCDTWCFSGTRVQSSRKLFHTVGYIIYCIHYCSYEDKAQLLIAGNNKEMVDGGPQALVPNEMTTVTHSVFPVYRRDYPVSSDSVESEVSNETFWPITGCQMKPSSHRGEWMNEWKQKGLLLHFCVKIEPVATDFVDDWSFE